MGDPVAPAPGHLRAYQSNTTAGPNPKHSARLEVVVGVRKRPDYDAIDFWCLRDGWVSHKVVADEYAWRVAWGLAPGRW